MPNLRQSLVVRIKGATCVALAFFVALMFFLFIALCSAQQVSTNIHPDGPVIGGDGVRNYIAYWATPNYLLSSAIYQASGGNVGVATTTPVAQLDVNGNINSATTYGIGGSTVVSIGSGSDWNLFLGREAGSNNVPAHGVENTFVGADAGEFNTTGEGNTFSGTFAGYNNTTGFENTFVGAGAGEFNTTGLLNTFTGFFAGYENTTGVGNAFYGFQAGYVDTTGCCNTFSGSFAGYYNTTGRYDIYIANEGPQSGTESNTIRIGTEGTQTAAYMAGIDSSNLSSGLPVYISNGQLGVQTSSLRFKEQIQDMGDTTNALMKLRPVTFFYKPEYSKGDRTLQYGLIAEEVAQVYPELVAYDNDGQPYSVRYQYITTMLLNEVQKQYRRAEDEAKAKAVETQQQKIYELEQRLSRLESLIGSPVKVAQDNMPSVVAQGGAQ